MAEELQRSRSIAAFFAGGRLSYRRVRAYPRAVHREGGEAHTARKLASLDGSRTSFYSTLKGSRELV